VGPATEFMYSYQELCTELSTYVLTYLLYRCELCSCDLAGSVGDVCDVTSGQCPCKNLTSSRTCGQCKDGSSNLDPANPFGCSRGISAAAAVSFVSVIYGLSYVIGPTIYIFMLSFVLSFLFFFFFFFPRLISAVAQ